MRAWLRQIAVAMPVMLCDDAHSVEENYVFVMLTFVMSVCIVMMPLGWVSRMLLRPNLLSIYVMFSVRALPGALAGIQWDKAMPFEGRAEGGWPLTVTPRPLVRAEEDTCLAGVSTAV